jgi:hypothetical protein
MSYRDLIAPRTSDQPRGDCREFVIVASGPSLTRKQIETLLRAGRTQPRFMVVNNSYQMLVGFAFEHKPILYACDGRWWDRHKGKIDRDKFECWTQDEDAAEMHGLNYIRSARRPGLGVLPGVIHQGGNSGYQAINLTYKFGAKLIYLLGFDMKAKGSAVHWHSPHPGPNPTAANFLRWKKQFNDLAADLAEAGVKVINATPNSDLACFQRMQLP